MANREDYKGLLGERLESAYKAKGNIKPPSEVDIARWKQLAKARKREKRRRAKIVASLASAFAMVFCISIVSMFQIPDAQAGEDQIIDLVDSRDDEEAMTVASYTDYENLPKDIEEEFIIFHDLPEEYKLSEMRVITIGQNKRCESQFTNKEGDSFTIKQRKISDGETTVKTFENDEVVNWYGMDVYIKRYTNNRESTLYKLVYEEFFFSVMADKGVEDEVVKETIKEAII